MTLSLLFWLLMLLWAVFGLWWPNRATPLAAFLPGNLLLFVLIAMLGWKVFGPAIRG